MTKRAARSPSIGAEIIEGLREALAHARGDGGSLKVTRAMLVSRGAEVVPSPRFDAARISRLRDRLHLSQPVFAAALNVSPETLKKWEQGTRVPDGAALRLLELAEAHPEWIIDRIRPVRSAGTASRSRARPKSNR